MTIAEVQREILRLKKERDICILAHAYQSKEIAEVADYFGDSYGLAVEAAKASQNTVLMCGVRFMAETVKLLSPNKTVLLANPTAGCPMAEQMDLELVEAAKKRYPDYAVVAYINTTTRLKTICDVCVTSSSAERILRRMPEEKILFLPDCNLGEYLQNRLPEKQFHLLQGGCPTHAKISGSAVTLAKEAHPNALVLVHPECRPEVVKQADFVGSTTAIMKYAEESEQKEFIIGTENRIAEHLSYRCPEKRFYPLHKELICPNMRVTTLTDVLQAVAGTGGEEILLDEPTITAARRCIDKMLELGG